MTDHHDDIEDDTTMPTPTDGAIDHRAKDPGATRFDTHRTDFEAPTAPYKRVPQAARRVTSSPYVSPPGAYTTTATGAQAQHTTWSDGTPVRAVPEAVEVLNRILDDTPAPAARRGPSLREVAEQREVEKLRAERRLERLEAARAWVTLAILVALFLLVVGAGVVGYGILSGWFTWAPTRTR